MSEWISVKDRMPEEGSQVLVWDGFDMECGTWRYGSWACSADYRYSATHWMPLPSPPGAA